MKKLVKGIAGVTAGAAMILTAGCTEKAPQTTAETGHEHTAFVAPLQFSGNAHFQSDVFPESIFNGDRQARTAISFIDVALSGCNKQLNVLPIEDAQKIGAVITHVFYAPENTLTDVDVVDGVHCKEVSFAMPEQLGVDISGLPFGAIKFMKQDNGHYIANDATKGITFTPENATYLG